MNFVWYYLVTEYKYADFESNIIKLVEKESVVQNPMSYVVDPLKRF